MGAQLLFLEKFRVQLAQQSMLRKSKRTPIRNAAQNNNFMNAVLFGR